MLGICRGLRPHLLRTLLPILFVALVAPLAHADDIKEQIRGIEAQLSEIVANPARMSYIRGLVSMQVDYRIAVKLRGYEQTNEFRDAVWQNFNAVLYEDGIDRIKQLYKGPGTIPDDTVAAMAGAYEEQAEQYDKFVRDFLEKSKAKLEDGVTELRNAMATYAVMNAVLESDASKAGWFSGSFVFPFCKRKE